MMSRPRGITAWLLVTAKSALIAHQLHAGSSSHDAAWLRYSLVYPRVMP